jgi:hypothetical protein
MKLSESRKMYYYVDESGDPVFFDKKGNDLVKIGKASRVFIAGYMECEKPNLIHKALEKIRLEIKDDPYLSPVPSMQKSLKHFHAKDDCPEVREKVFKEIVKMNVKCCVIVGRKNADQFRKKFNGKTLKLYEF